MSIENKIKFGITQFDYENRDKLPDKIKYLYADYVRISDRRCRLKQYMLSNEFKQLNETQKEAINNMYKCIKEYSNSINEVINNISEKYIK